MKPGIFCMLFLWLMVLYPFQAISSQAQTTGLQKVKTDHLALEVDPSSGTMTLNVFNESGEEVYQTDIYNLKVDGRIQTNFSVIQEAPLIIGNATIRIEFEILDERTIATRQIPVDGKSHNFELSIRSDDPTRYYGTGERFNALNQRGYILPMITDDRYGNKGVGSHKPVPFVMSSRGFGFWLDTYAPSQFDLSGTERFETKISARDTKMRAVFFGGPKMVDILDAFTSQTGKTTVPPPWAFGLWKSRDVHHNRDSVLVDIRKPRELDIPASVIVLDSPWETGYNNFIVNREQFPDPESMFNLMLQRGYYPALWLTPFINSKNVKDMEGITEGSSNYEEAVEKGVLVTDSTGKVSQMEWWKGVGGLVDFTDPDAIDWWFSEMDKALSTGVRAFKADDGEGNFVPDAVFHDGTSAEKMKNRYAVLYDSVMQAYVDDRLDSNGVLITRTGYTGTQQYPFAWAGDNQGDFSFDEGLPSVILAGQNAAMSGFSLWGSDIAGYAGTADKEVFIRWTQFSAFTPFMQVHMTSNKGPWDYDDETLEIFRKFTSLRTQLFPYLYEAVHESAEMGMPVIRPMALAFPGDGEAATRIYQYMFGPNILVAPVYQRVSERNVYLPEGKWVDYWTGKKHEGPADLEVSAPLDRMPLFVQAGAILPLIPEEVETLIPRHEKMDNDIVALDERRVLQVWPGEKGSIETRDGLRADFTKVKEGYELLIQPGDLKVVEVVFPFQEIKLLNMPETALSYNSQRQASIVKLPDKKEEIRLQWSLIE